MTQAMNLANFANNLDTSGGLNPSALNAATPISKGGTAATTAAGARASLSAAVLGANSDITSLTGLTTPLSIAQGGTGTSSTTFANLTSNVTGTLPVANGGTNSTATPIAGGAGYGTGTAHAYTAAGTAGQVLVSAGSGAPAWASRIVSGTAVSTTSGTSVSFTGIPSWVKRITIMLNGIATSVSSPLQLQIGSGSIAVTGYDVSVGETSAAGAGSSSVTTGFQLVRTVSLSDTVSGTLVLTNISGNIWIGSSVTANTTATRIIYSAGRISLSGVLDRLLLTTISGTATFSAGSINILYE